jgi:hypothetical protein
MVPAGQESPGRLSHLYPLSPMKITETDQFPATVNVRRKGDDILVPGHLIKKVTLPDGTEQKLLRDGAIGRFTRKGDGSQVLKLRWRSKWWEVPTMEDVERWTFDSVCETPAGDIIEPDADGSWLRLLGLV